MIATQQVGFLEAFKLFWLNYVNFKGRSRRSEYWWVMLWHTIIILPLVILGFISLIITPILAFIIFFIIILYCFATMIPNLALTVRRFHDNGFSMLIPIINVVIGILYNIVNIFIEQTDVYHAGNSTITAHSGFIPFFVAIIFMFVMFGLQIFTLVICLLDSKKETNQYGPSPKYVQNATPYKGVNDGGMTHEGSSMSHANEHLDTNADTSYPHKEEEMSDYKNR
ncbi:DUF805 domain-containing protein [Staphylococcus hyicus]|uniref:DUF805 domain-containing protein n=1 Tax=Staphylococcus hyicus TaxID=1284 RepID=A0ACD5FQP4_STAHY|nr:DUF805 domain-containing protein [Staphylococcus hyicus]MDP4462952.1 DUF805 domain-containing protein [Staphylococcus hyicus]